MVIVINNYKKNCIITYLRSTKICQKAVMKSDVTSLIYKNVGYRFKLTDFNDYDKIDLASAVHPSFPLNGLSFPW